jgi:hypothetical protein
MAEQVGFGGTNISSPYQPMFGGVTVAPSKPTIATVPQTSTTADVAAIGTAVNALIAALKALGLAA